MKTEKTKCSECGKDCGNIFFLIGKENSNGFELRCEGENGFPVCGGCMIQIPKENLFGGFPVWRAKVENGELKLLTGVLAQLGPQTLIRSFHNVAKEFYNFTDASDVVYTEAASTEDIKDAANRWRIFCLEHPLNFSESGDIEYANKTIALQLKEELPKILVYKGSLIQINMTWDKKDGYHLSMSSPVTETVPEKLLWEVAEMFLELNKEEIKAFKYSKTSPVVHFMAK